MGGDAHALALIAALRRRRGGLGERRCVERVCACAVRVVTPHTTTTPAGLNSAIRCFTSKRLDTCVLANLLCISQRRSGCFFQAVAD